MSKLDSESNNWAEGGPCLNCLLENDGIIVVCVSRGSRCMWRTKSLVCKNSPKLGKTSMPPLLFSVFPKTITCRLSIHLVNGIDPQQKIYSKITRMYNRLGREGQESAVRKGFKLKLGSPFFFFIEKMCDHCFDVLHILDNQRKRTAGFSVLICQKCSIFLPLCRQLLSGLHPYRSR